MLERKVIREHKHRAICKIPQFARWLQTKPSDYKCKFCAASEMDFWKAVVPDRYTDGRGLPPSI